MRILEETKEENQRLKQQLNLSLYWGKEGDLIREVI